MSFKSLFLPDNKKFFLLFDKVADNLVQMSQLFLEGVRKDEATIDQHILLLDEIEKANDTLTHKLFIELGKNFITPFDREDIHYLASGLDDIIDDMLGIVKQMRSHKIDVGEGIAIAVAELNQKAIDMLSETLRGLRYTRSLNALKIKCDRIKTVTATAADIIDGATSALFREHISALDIVRKMDHYEKLQQLMKRDYDAVNVIESIIIKYG